MKQKLIENTLVNVKQSYNNISFDFTRTRHRSWPEIDSLIKKYVKDNCEILDAGCGNGRLVGSLTDLDIKLNYIGLDNSEELLSRAWENYGDKYRKVKIVWQLGNMQSLPFPDKSFDIVFAVASIHHLPSFQLRLQAMQEFQRVLRPRGILVMTNWNLFTFQAFEKYNLWLQISNVFKGYEWGDFIIPWKNSSGSIQALRFYHSFNKKETQKLFAKSGFRLKSYQNTWLNKHKKSVAKSIITVGRKIDKSM